MAKVPITVMGYRCDRCEHEWIPRDFAEEPRVCPKCKSRYWNRPRKKAMTYEYFRDRIAKTLRERGTAATWTEIRTYAGLPQAFPNNLWVRRMEADIATRTREGPARHHAVAFEMKARKSAVRSAQLKLPTDPPKMQLTNKTTWNESRAKEAADFFTIGYSGRTIEAFLAAVVDARIRCVVDVRATL